MQQEKCYASLVCFSPVSARHNTYLTAVPLYWHHQRWRAHSWQAKQLPFLSYKPTTSSIIQDHNTKKRYSERKNYYKKEVKEKRMKRMRKGLMNTFCLLRKTQAGHQHPLPLIRRSSVLEEHTAFCHLIVLNPVSAPFFRSSGFFLLLSKTFGWIFPLIKVAICLFISFITFLIPLLPGGWKKKGRGNMNGSSQVVFLHCFFLNVLL